MAIAPATAKEGPGLYYRQSLGDHVLELAG